jgi:hypothetical protein
MRAWLACQLVNLSTIHISKMLTNPLTAHVVSSLYSPFYLPVVAFVVLFLFSYLNMLPMQTKVILTLIVYFSTMAAATSATLGLKCTSATSGRS